MVHGEIEVSRLRVGFVFSETVAEVSLFHQKYK